MINDFSLWHPPHIHSWHVPPKTESHPANHSLKPHYNDGACGDLGRLGLGGWVSMWLDMPRWVGVLRAQRIGCLQKVSVPRRVQPNSFRVSPTVDRAETDRAVMKNVRSIISSLPSLAVLHLQARPSSEEGGLWQPRYQGLQV